MASMSAIRKHWDTGDTQVWYPSSMKGAFAIQRRFLEHSGATRVLQLTWQWNGQEVSCPYPATVLPDLSGVVLIDEWHFQGAPREGPEPYRQHLRVLNPDGNLRLRIFAPVVDEHSRPEEAFIEEPLDFSDLGFPFAAVAFDGHWMMIVDYDWHTGQMLRWAPIDTRRL